MGASLSSLGRHIHVTIPGKGAGNRDLHLTHTHVALDERKRREQYKGKDGTKCDLGTYCPDPQQCIQVTPYASGIEVGRASASHGLGKKGQGQAV